MSNLDLLECNFIEIKLINPKVRLKLPNSSGSTALVDKRVAPQNKFGSVSMFASASRVTIGNV